MSAIEIVVCRRGCASQYKVNLLTGPTFSNELWVQISSPRK